MAQGDPMKWHMPGWRIEQRFAPGVLIGNWSEERYTVSFLQQFNGSKELSGNFLRNQLYLLFNMQLEK